MPSITYPKIKRAPARLLGLLFWLAVWQAAAIAVGHEFLLASPLRVLVSLFELLSKPGTYLVAGRSTWRILLGFLAAFAFALVLAAAASKWELARALAAPLVSAARAVPVASFVILAIILVSTKWLSSLIAFVIGFPVIYSNLLEGLHGRDPKLSEMAFIFNVSPLRRLLYVNLPQLAPYLRAGAVSALGLCFKSGVAAEVIGIPPGTIGEKLYSVKVNYYTAELFAWTVIIVLLSLLCVYSLRRLMDLSIRWLDLR
jgi:NitT/TauT family transport system permease protein